MSRPTGIIRTLPSLMSDANKPEDVDTDGEDHAADALRYFVMARPSPSASARKDAPGEWTIGWLKSRMTQKTGMLSGNGVRVA